MILTVAIAEYLGDAEAGKVRGAAGSRFTREELRGLRGSLAHVDSALGALELDAVRGRQVGALVDDLRAAGLSNGRVDGIVDALRSVYAYAIGRGLVATSPLVGLAPAAAETRAPTDALLALGASVVGWTVKAVVIAFVLVTVGLFVALA
jgi:hypothetical protein